MSRHHRFTVRHVLVAAVAAGAAVVVAGCGGPFDYNGSHEPDLPPGADAPRAVDPWTQTLPSIVDPPKTYSNPDPATLRACASFVTVEHLVQRTVTPDKRPDGTIRPASNLIDLADTVNNTRRPGLSDPLDRAFTAYAYALASLGAHIDHKQPADEISEMIQVVNNVGGVIKALCREPSSSPAEEFEDSPGRSDSERGTQPGSFGLDDPVPSKSVGR